MMRAAGKTYRTALMGCTATGALALALSFGLTTAALGQTAPAAPSAPAAGKNVDTIEEIVVTARRKEERQEDVPVSVTALGAADLAAESVATASDVQFHVPGLEINNGAYFGNAEPSFVIRGLLSTAPGGSIADPDVVTYFAGVPQINNRAISNALYDLENVQVLYGPQGTLFGKNSPGGAVLFEPTHPTDQTEGSMEASFGDYGLWRLTPVVNVAVADGLDIRIAGQVSQHDGYVQNLSGPDLDDQDYYSGRIGVNYKPNSSFETYTLLEGYDSHAQGSAEVAYQLGASALGLYGDTTPGSFTNPAYGPIGQLLAQQLARGPWVVNMPTTVSAGGTTLNTNGDLISIYTYDLTNVSQYHVNENLTLKNIVSYSHQTDEFNLNQSSLDYPILANYYKDDLSQWSEEFQVLGSSLDKKLDWIVGTYYSHQDSRNIDVSNILTPVITDQIYTNGSADSNAVFGQGTYDLGVILPGLKFTGGYRYTWDQKSESSSSFQEEFSPPECRLVGTASCVKNSSALFQAPDWTVGLDYHFMDNAMVYVASRRGFRSGGFNATASEPGYGEYAPEKLTDVEVGVKADWKLGDMPVRTNVDIYRGEFDGATVAPVVAYNGGQDQIILNTAGAVIRGGEATFSIRPTQGLELTANYALTIGQYDQGSGEPLAFDTSGKAIMTSVSHCFAPTGATFVDLSGCPLLGSSKHTVTASARYFIPIDDQYGSLMTEADYAWRSPQSLPQGFLPAFGIINMRLEWDDVFNKPFDVSFWVKNLTDKTYLTNQQQLADSLGVNEQQYGDPRTFGATLTYHW